MLLGKPGKAPRAGIQVSPQRSRESWAKGQGLQAGGAACRKAPDEAVQPTRPHGSQTTSIRQCARAAGAGRHHWVLIGVQR